MNIRGPGFLFGVPAEVRPIRNIGNAVKVRLRFRENEFALVFLRYSYGLLVYYLSEDGPNHWKLDTLKASNIRFNT